MSKLLLLIVTIVGLYSLVSLNPVSYAQDEQSGTIIVAITPDGFHFYNLDPNGATIPMLALSGQFSLYIQDIPTTWIIPSYVHMKLSPNQQSLAITAVNGNRADLVIVGADGAIGNVLQIPSAGLVPEWSPDGSAILLSPPFPYVGYENWNSIATYTETEAYVYELAGSALVQIVSSPEILEIEYQWLSDSSGLVFNGRDNLYIVGRDGRNRRSLTNFDNDGMNICLITPWEAQSRWLYATNCTDYSAQRIYSTSLAADNRLEMDLAGWYTQDVLFARLASLITLDSIYAVISVQGVTNHWLLLRIDEPGTAIVASQNTIEGEILYAELSPDNTSIALVGQESFAVVDLTSGQKTLDVEISETLRICNLTWLDSSQFLYSNELYACNSISSIPQGVVGSRFTSEGFGEIALSPMDTSEIEFILPR